MSIHRPDISACDHCGECCKSPCMLGGMSDVRRIAGFISMSIPNLVMRMLNVEQTPSGNMVVRPKRDTNGYCVFHKEGKCSIHKVKPKGGQEFECWNTDTFHPEAHYHWRKSDAVKVHKSLARIGVKVVGTRPKAVGVQ